MNAPTRIAALGLLALLALTTCPRARACPPPGEPLEDLSKAIMTGDNRSFEAFEKRLLSPNSPWLSFGSLTLKVSGWIGGGGDHRVFSLQAICEEGKEVSARVPQALRLNKHPRPWLSAARQRARLFALLGQRGVRQTNPRVFTVPVARRGAATIIIEDHLEAPTIREYWGRFDELSVLARIEYLQAGAEFEREISENVTEATDLINKNIVYFPEEPDLFRRFAVVDADRTYSRSASRAEIIPYVDRLSPLEDRTDTQWLIYLKILHRISRHFGVPLTSPRAARLTEGFLLASGLASLQAFPARRTWYAEIPRALQIELEFEVFAYARDLTGWDLALRVPNYVVQEHPYLRSLSGIFGANGDSAPGALATWLESHAGELRDPGRLRMFWTVFRQRSPQDNLAQLSASDLEALVNWLLTGLRGNEFYRLDLHSERAYRTDRAGDTRDAREVLLPYAEALAKKLAPTLTPTELRRMMSMLNRFTSNGNYLSKLEKKLCAKALKNAH